MAAQSYQIVVRRLAQSAWVARFDEVEILPLGSDQYLLRGIVPDEPALHGLLSRIGAAGLDLVSVKFSPSRKDDCHEY